MSEELELVVDRSWEIWHHYKGLWCYGPTQRRAVKRVAEYAYHQGRAYERGAYKEPPKKKAGAMRVVVEQHRPLMGVLITIATSVTASTAATGLGSGWILALAGWLGPVITGLVIGIRQWLSGK